MHWASFVPDVRFHLASPTYPSISTLPTSTITMITPRTAFVALAAALVGSAVAAPAAGDGESRASSTASRLAHRAAPTSLQDEVEHEPVHSSCCSIVLKSCYDASSRQAGCRLYRGPRADAHPPPSPQGRSGTSLHTHWLFRQLEHVQPPRVSVVSLWLGAAGP